MRLRRIDIGSWESEVAREHRVRSLPSLRLYDGKKLVSDDLREVLKILAKPAAGPAR